MIASGKIARNSTAVKKETTVKAKYIELDSRSLRILQSFSILRNIVCGSTTSPNIDKSVFCSYVKVEAFVKTVTKRRTLEMLECFAVLSGSKIFCRILKSCQPREDDTIIFKVPLVCKSGSCSTLLVNSKIIPANKEKVFINMSKILKKREKHCQKSSIFRSSLSRCEPKLFTVCIFPNSCVCHV